MDRSKYDHMRRVLGLVEFFQPSPTTEKYGLRQAVVELQSVSVVHWRERKPGAIPMFGLTSLIDGIFLDGDLDPLHGDVEQALAELNESDPQHGLVQTIREAASWPSYFDVARRALDAFEYIDWYLGEGVGSTQRNEIISARLEAQGMARHAEGIDGDRFLYGFGRLFQTLNEWQDRVLQQ